MTGVQTCALPIFDLAGLGDPHQLEHPGERAGEELEDGRVVGDEQNQGPPGDDQGHRAMSPLPLRLSVLLPDVKFSHPVYLARVAGFESAHDGIRIRCLTTWLYPIIKSSVFSFLWGG